MPFKQHLHTHRDGIKIVPSWGIFELTANNGLFFQFQRVKTDTLVKKDNRQYHTLKCDG